ncbi:MAG: hypothetical protein K940chlam7_00125 [Chlamydiae bacterium]|nr:hypothetical protein [Chlamydiota bacterium]
MNSLQPAVQDTSYVNNHHGYETATALSAQEKQNVKGALENSSIENLLKNPIVTKALNKSNKGEIDNLLANYEQLNHQITGIDNLCRELLSESSKYDVNSRKWKELDRQRFARQDDRSNLVRLLWGYSDKIRAIIREAANIV